MGTTYRSVISWAIPATTIELLPSVPRLFSFYHDDGAQILASPLSHLVIDDGRRYLERSTQKYDAIIIDPPPPVQAAGFSLLFSEEFYAVAKERLWPGGILQQWLPRGTMQCKRRLRALYGFLSPTCASTNQSWAGVGTSSQACVRFLLAMPRDLVARMPTKSIVDLMEWGPARLHPAV